MNKREEKTLNQDRSYENIICQNSRKPEIRKALLEYKTKYGILRFFSYGSNLNEPDFKKKMLAIADDLEVSLKPSEAGLVHKNICTLNGFKRFLKNKSSNHGAAYTINPRKNHSVSGVCHDITADALHPFMAKEALTIQSPNYKVIEINVEGETNPVLTLVGNNSINLKELPKDDKLKALEYLKICIQGASILKINSDDMIATKEYLTSLIKKESGGTNS